MDIKKPDLNAILEKLSFLRNNLALLVPIILVVVAGLLFIPTELLSKSLQKKMKAESVSKGTTLRRYSEAVISKKEAEVEREYQKNYAHDANQIELMSLQSSKRALLNYKIFPTTMDTSVLIFEDFGKSYCAGIEAMFEQGGANECPTSAELGIAGQGAAGRGGMGGRGGMDLYGGAGYGYQTPGAGGTGLPGFGNTQKIKDAICMERAASSTFYASLADISGYDYWADYSYDASTAEAVEDCWYWQLGYWIIEDIFDTVAACNQGSTSVFSSPVKRLNRVAFDLGANMMMMMGRGGRSNDDPAAGRPSYVPDKYTVLAPACTSRVSDEEIDIVHFNVVVVVQAKYVLSFMKELCSAREHVYRGVTGQEPEQRYQHNAISILQSTASTMERKGPMHNLYRYGEDAVVELNLICEYLFEKAGFETDGKTLIPDVVLEKLKGEDEEGQL